jgi:hypothetical protein
MYKCNTKNAVILENYLYKRRKAMLQNNPQMQKPLLASVPHHASAPAVIK